jgi:hypothetical protein
MSVKVRFDATIKGWYFPSVTGLYYHSNAFWLYEEKCKIVFNNGSKSVLVGNTKYGIKKLRQDALPCEIKLLDACPF